MYSETLAHTRTHTHTHRTDTSTQLSLRQRMLRLLPAACCQLLTAATQPFALHSSPLHWRWSDFTSPLHRPLSHQLLVYPFQSTCTALHFSTLSFIAFFKWHLPVKRWWGGARAAGLPANILAQFTVTQTGMQAALSSYSVGQITGRSVAAARAYSNAKDQRTGSEWSSIPVCW